MDTNKDLYTQIANIALVRHLVNSRIERLRLELSTLEETSSDLNRAIAMFINKMGKSLATMETQPIYQTLVAASLNQNDTPDDLIERQILQDWIQNEFDMIFK